MHKCIINVLLFCCSDFNSEYLRCDCHLRWLVKWSKSKKVRVHSSTKCALPQAMKGLTFNKLRRSELHCSTLPSSYCLSLSVNRELEFQTYLSAMIS